MKTQILTDMQVAWSCDNDYPYTISGVTAILINFPNVNRFMHLLNISVDWAIVYYITVRTTEIGTDIDI
jgi:hypothetical protein